MKNAQIRSTMKIPSILINKAKELEEYYKIHYKPLAPLAARCFLTVSYTHLEGTLDLAQHLSAVMTLEMAAKLGDS